jgi:hypothetical protein
MPEQSVLDDWCVRWRKPHAEISFNAAHTASKIDSLARSLAQLVAQLIKAVGWFFKQLAKGNMALTARLLF